MSLTNQWVQFSVATPLQQAAAYALAEAERPYKGYPTYDVCWSVPWLPCLTSPHMCFCLFVSYYEYLATRYKEKRDLLAGALRAAGIDPILPDGGIFIVADTGRLEVPAAYLSDSTEACPVMTRDWALCRWLTIEKRVTAIPPSAFCCAENKHLAANLARFAYCKKDSDLEAAAANLKT